MDSVVLGFATLDGSGDGALGSIMDSVVLGFTTLGGGVDGALGFRSLTI
jgi:hypothetical protein